jgi:hypothetical protein
MKTKIDALAARRDAKLIVDRGEVETKLYHRCRECRDKLPRPVENKNKAFCCRGCSKDFYRTRCVVCENDKPAESTSRRVLCRRPKCAGRYSRDRAFYSFPSPGKADRDDQIRRSDWEPHAPSGPIDDGLEIPAFPRRAGGER